MPHCHRPRVPSRSSDGSHPSGCDARDTGNGRTGTVSQESTDGRESGEDGPLTVGDDQLPEELRPSEDNPLAQPADDDVPDDLLAQHAAAETGSGENSEDATSTGGDDVSDTSSATASSEAQSSEAQSSEAQSSDTQYSETESRAD
jgi:hypothetical protein